MSIMENNGGDVSNETDDLNDDEYGEDSKIELQFTTYFVLDIRASIIEEVINHFAKTLNIADHQRYLDEKLLNIQSMIVTPIGEPTYRNENFYSQSYEFKWDFRIKADFHYRDYDLYDIDGLVRKEPDIFIDDFLHFLLSKKLVDSTYNVVIVCTSNRVSKFVDSTQLEISRHRIKKLLDENKTKEFWIKSKREAGDPVYYSIYALSKVDWDKLITNVSSGREDIQEELYEMIEYLPYRFIDGGFMPIEFYD